MQYFKSDYDHWTRFQVRAVQIGSKCKDLKSSPVRTGGFGMTSQTNELLIISSPWTELILIKS